MNVLLTPLPPPSMQVKESLGHSTFTVFSQVPTPPHPPLHRLNYIVFLLSPLLIKKCIHIIQQNVNQLM